jgi:hypothetical protein
MDTQTLIVRLEQRLHSAVAACVEAGELLERRRIEVALLKLDLQLELKALNDEWNNSEFDFDLSRN